jgi:hypothetical protein
MYIRMCIYIYLYIMYLCMYVCISVCMYVCTYVYLYVHLYVCMCVCGRVRACPHTHISPPTSYQLPSFMKLKTTLWRRSTLLRVILLLVGTQNTNTAFIWHIAAYLCSGGCLLISCRNNRDIPAAQAKLCGFPHSTAECWANSFGIFIFALFNVILFIYFSLIYWRAPQQMLRKHRSLEGLLCNPMRKMMKMMTVFLLFNFKGAPVERNWQGKTKYSEKTLSQCHFVHHKSHMERPEPGPPRWVDGD